MSKTKRSNKSKPVPIPIVINLSSESDTDADIDVVGYDDESDELTIVFEKSQTGSDDSVIVCEVEEVDPLSYCDETNVTVSSVPFSSAPESVSTVVCNSVASENISKSNVTEVTSNNNMEIEVDQLPSTTTPPAMQDVLFCDSVIAEFIGDVITPELFQNNNEANESDLQNPEDCVVELDDSNNVEMMQTESPQPSTSKSCITGKKRKERSTDTDSSNTKEKETSSPEKRVRFCDTISSASRDSVDSGEQPSASDTDSNEDVPIQRNQLKVRKRPTIISSESDEESSSSLFETIIVPKKNVKTKTSSSSSSKNKSNNKRRPQQRRFKGVETKGSKIKPPHVTHSDSSSTDDDDDNQQEDTNDKNDTKKKERERGSRRSTRRVSKITEKENAFELLRQRREKMANKPKRPSPERPVGSNDEYSDDSDSDSTYSPGSPCPIVENSTPEGSDFDGSTPSSSSVSGVTDEEPDLESGSDGEKDLKTETKDEQIVNSDDDDDESDKSQTSSSDGEPPDDGQNDQRCALCKNLGSVTIKGRRKSAVSGSCSWCKCGECRIVSSEVRDYDLVCCREVQAVVDFINEELEDSKVCITKHPRFERDVLNYEGYARSVSKHSEARRYQTSFYGMFHEHYTAGKADYKKAEEAKRNFEQSGSFGKYRKCLSSYVRWIFDVPERGLMVIPACVQNKIREAYETPNLVFQTFRPYDLCPTGSHCKLAMAPDEESDD